MRVQWFPCTAQGNGKGAILFPQKENSPLIPKRKGRGAPPRPRTLAVSILKSCSACGIGCGVHGFAMNPCESLRLATAPYYREARVTFAWRRTACGMRHCFARRIDGCLGRRKLGCTTTRQAERHPQGVCRIRKASEPPTAAQQRIIGAESNRLATPNAATPRAGSSIGKHCSSSSCSLAILKNLSLGGFKGDILFCEREYPPSPAGTQGILGLS